ncbi:hypothetical protein P9112_010764 [Eukaryota sp. TZLM1-RC]
MTLFISQESFHDAAHRSVPPLATEEAEVLDNSLFGDNHIITGIESEDTLTDEQFSADERPRSIIKALLKQVRPGADLSRITLPTFILEPRSLLEKLTDCHAHPYLLSKVRHINHPLDRIISVARWYSSGFHTRPRGVKKPYNPLLGEVFQAEWDVQGSKVQYTAEQVSHHPPVSAFYLSSPKDGYSVEGSIKFKSQFLGNAAAALMLGHADVSLLGDFGGKSSEVYRITFPKYVSRGVLVGTLFMELNGNCSVEGLDNNLVVNFEFKKKGIFGGQSKLGLVEGSIMIRPPLDSTGKAQKDIEIARIHGNWMSELNIEWLVQNPHKLYDEVVNFNRDNSAEYSAFLKHIRKSILKTPVCQEPLFNVSAFPPLKKSVKDVNDQGQWESRRLWKNLTKSLKENDFDSATMHKSALENEQRSRRSQHYERLDAEGISHEESNWHTPCLFEKTTVSADGVEVWVPKKNVLETGDVGGEEVEGSLEEFSGFEFVDKEWVEKWRECRQMLG